MAQMMRAAQYDKLRDQIIVHDIPIPRPGHNELLIKVTAASLCHSDLMRNLRPADINKPITIGHEGVGIVSAIHPSVLEQKTPTGLQVGDRVGMFYIHDVCFECEGCAIHGTFCNKPRNGWAKIQGLQKDGFFAEYAVIDWRNAVKLPTNNSHTLPLDRMSPFFCAGVTAFHAVDKCNLQPGQWLAVVGCGGVGQLAIRYAKAMKLNVVALDVSDSVLELVQRQDLGSRGTAVPDAVLNPLSTPDFVKRIRKLTGLRGVHAAAVFSDSSAAYATAQKILAYNGIMMVVGIPPQDLSFSPIVLSLGLIQVRGASNGTVQEVGRALDFTVKHGIIPDVEIRDLSDMPKMWEEMESGRAKRKMVVLFEDVDRAKRETRLGDGIRGSRL